MPKEELSLEELSAATGMTARNVRAYQTKGLLPPPARSGRRSVYGVEHLQRLQAIERARAKGASLSLIAAHLAAGRRLDDDTLVDWARTVPDGAGHPARSPAAGAQGAARPVTAGDAAGAGDLVGANDLVGAGGLADDLGAHDITPLLARLDIQRDAEAQADVEELLAAGVLRPLGGRVVTGRQLAEALRDLQRQGLPLQVALGVAQRALHAAAPVAAALVDAARALPVQAGDPLAASRGHLGEVACYVIKHVVTQQVPPGDAGPIPG